MKHELLAPAGNLEAGYAALFYGADAVYLGLTKFSARAGAENFSLEELDEFTAYAHSLGRKVFVALNTILTENETTELPEVIAGLKKAKVDALIVQDLGVVYVVKRLAPEIELHASTQMAVHNVEGARFLQSLGFKRVVLARELSLKEIKEIAGALPDLDLEVFVHGALCYCYSGQCLFSALEFGKSANRGRCAYPCRAMYKRTDSEGKTDFGHFFSMKDMALEEDVRQLPVLSLKIEGRKKSPLYVAAVTNFYRHLLDGKKKDETEAEDIKQIFSRPWCRFHVNMRDKNVVDREFVGHRGVVIGKVEKVKGEKLCFKTMRGFARFDGLQIDVKGEEKPFGFGVKNLFLNNKSVFEVEAGEYVEAEMPDDRPHIEIGAPIYLASSSKVKGKYGYQKPRPKAYRNAGSYSVRVEISENVIWAMSGTEAVSVQGVFDKAKDVVKTNEAVNTAFQKTGDTAIDFTDIDVINPNGLFVPISCLNDLRRKLVGILSEINDEAVVELPKLKPYQGEKKLQKVLMYSLNMNCKVSDFKQEILGNGWFQLPQICRNTVRLKKVIEDFYQAGVRHFVAENYYVFDMLKGYPDVEIGAGCFLYVMNSFATAVLKDIGCKWATLALESSAENMVDVVKKAMLPMVEADRAKVPLFTSAVCIRDNDCQHCDKKRMTWKLQAGGREYIAVSENCEVKVYKK